MSTYNRMSPGLLRIKERYLLTKPTSTRQTYHIALDLMDQTVPFTVGDSIAILPENDPAVVEKILKSAHFTGNEEIIEPKTKQKLALRSFLQTKANLAKVPARFLSLLKVSLPTEEPLHALDLMRLYPKASFSPEEFAASFLPLMPRFYSIASSSKVFPKEIHLTVSLLSYPCQGETRYGVASYFLCKQAHIESTPIPFYIQPSNGFTLPSPTDSIILIGPGTGIAPFRAFLQERLSQNAPGRNWLFFGERNQASDFYYEPFFKELAKKNFLRLSTAFSRDQAEKIYVQHKLEEEGASIWDWIQTGAFLYVCGDAQKMARDVDACLQRTIHKHGGLSEEEARLYLRRLKQEKRYLLDVY